jgi:hypothetical protein
MFAKDYRSTKFDTERQCLVSYNPNRESLSKVVVVTTFLICLYLLSVFIVNSCVQKGADSVKESLVCVTKDRLLTMQGFEATKAGSDFIFSKGTFEMTIPQNKCSFLQEVVPND